MNGQVGRQPGEGIAGLLAPITIRLYCQWNAGSAQLVHWSGVCEPLLQGLPHEPGDILAQYGRAEW